MVREAEGSKNKPGAFSDISGEKIAQVRLMRVGNQAGPVVRSDLKQGKKKGRSEHGVHSQGGLWFNMWWLA